MPNIIYIFLIIYYLAKVHYALNFKRINKIIKLYSDRMHSVFRAFLAKLALVSYNIKNLGKGRKT